MSEERKTQKKHHRINYTDRVFIQAQLEKKVRVAVIADYIGVSRAALYREIKRGTKDDMYDAEIAQKNIYRRGE